MNTCNMHSTTHVAICNYVRDNAYTANFLDTLQNRHVTRAREELRQKIYCIHFANSYEREYTAV